ncbi:hypothetical protein [Phytomonospora endophytica]|uniref:Uncharacterized protein n=1 Tax=Phytomonospora endophytica TaxID=714109 RepID=A0A841FZD0_9ACTN|nr:hypothetical protein [Phytomonospora endophytica]MBB6038882.1 hypothetical protein [Phytomonospora endophytica]GIG68323.1 hypothetical protein Pen01_46180 [Phytomonospora endophytica]
MSIKKWSARLAATLLAAAAVVLVAQPAAQAAVPDRVGFALWSGGVVSQAVPAGTTVSPVVPGRWLVKFPGQGIPGGAVHVTAVHDALTSPNGRFCQAERWGQDTAVPPNELVWVACYRTTGVLDPQPGFSVQFSASSGPVGGGLYGYMFNSPTCVVGSTYNSVGGANTCIHAGAGSYSITFNGLASPGPRDGGIQVTAVKAGAAARCQVAAWSSGPGGQSFRILCRNNLGVLTDTAFTATYQLKRSLYGPAFPPNRFGYVFNAPGAGPPSTNYNSITGSNAWGGGPPVWTIKYYQLYTTAPANSQATAFYSGLDTFCGLHRPWWNAGTDAIVEVNCFNTAGNPVNSAFTSSYSSRI